MEDGISKPISYFKFEEEFADYVDIFTLSGTIDGAESYNVIQAVVSFDPPVQESEHIITAGLQSGRIVNIPQERIINWKNEFSNDS